MAAERARVPGNVPPLLRRELVPLAVMEGRYVKEVLVHTSGNKQAASRLLGIDRKRLDRIIKRHNISLA